MKKIWKKLLAVTLAASMTMSMVSMTSLAAEGEEDPAGKVTLTYDANAEGVTGLPNPVIAGIGTEVEIDNCSDMTREGYEALGWSTTPDADQPNVGTTYTLTADTTLFAVWKSTPETEPGEETYAARIGDVGYATLQDAINAAQSGDTIVLTQNFTATGEEKPASGKWLYNINAVKTPVLTIDLGGYTVDCGGLYGWLYVNSGNSNMDLTVKNGTIKDAANCSMGSAINAWKNLTLDNVTFSGCSASSGGGAVYVGGSRGDANLTVTGCTFTDNSAGNSGGGAIWFAEAHKGNISNTTFTNNTATGFGGAFYVNGSEYDDTGVATLSSCIFEENTASSGGAVSSFDNCKLVITGCQFDKNTATVSGGAINTSGNTYATKPGYLEVTGNTSFTGNTAQYGGAIYGTYLSSSKLEDVTFTRNNATGAYGGAVYCYNAGGLTVDHVEATSNTSGNCGGAFFLNHAPATITNSTITYNTAAYGGGLYLSQSATTISNSTITDNTAAYGGGITNYFDKLTLAEGAKVHNNVAGNMGDDIYSSDAGYHDSYPASLELGEAASVELKSDNKTITGWFIDGQEGETTVTNRWSAEGFYKKFNGENSVVALKAAHDAYYTVTYTDGVEDAELFADQTANVLAGTATPAFDGTPTRSGYTFTGWNPEVADIVTGDVTYVAQWSANYVAPTYYTLTINYVDGEGNAVADSYRSGDHSYGWNYSVTSPVVEGMTPDQETVSGTLTRNTTITVTYAEDVDEPDTPTTESPEPTESPEVTETPAPTESPEESEDLGDNDTPLTELPEETETPEPTESQEPEEGEDLSDNDTPLAEVPQTGDMLWLWMTLAIGSAVSLAWISAEEKKGKRVSK